MINKRIQFRRLDRSVWQRSTKLHACFDHGDGSFDWSPIKVSRSAAKIGLGSSEDDLNPSESGAYLAGFQVAQKPPLHLA